MTRLLLHIGLPKTASTTIQDWAAANRTALARAGVLYPPSFLTAGLTKHQELAVTLMSGHQQAVSDLFDHISDTLDRTPDAHTVVLSTEGLAGHLPEGESQPEHLEILREFFAPFSETVLFMMQRDPQAWVRSYHQQKICNPPGPRFDHGTSMTLEAFTRSPRTRALMDYPALLARAMQAYGASRFVTSNLEENWPKAFCDTIGVPAMSDSLARYPHSNTGLSRPATELMRQLNAWGLPNGPMRTELVAWLRENSNAPLDRQLDQAISALIPQDDDQKQLIEKMHHALDQSPLSQPQTARQDI